MTSGDPDSASAHLEALIHKHVAGRLLVSVSNREPFIHTYRTDGSIAVTAAAGGLTLALNPVMQAVGGVWVAHGSGDADKETADSNGQLQVPPENPGYTLQRVWLDKQEFNGYYNGFANQALWPLCHIAYTKPVFRNEHWQAYKAVNEKFADIVAGIVGNREAILFIQDYHFALLPGILRKRCPQAVFLHFWHIPWPPADVFDICPWKNEILEGLLGNDLFGVHTPQYALRFKEALKHLPSYECFGENEVCKPRHQTSVKAFPISIDFHAVSERANSLECDLAVEKLHNHFNISGKFIVLGLDRIDYTKGVLERLQAIESLLERYPDMHHKIVFMYAGLPSRTDIPAYKQLHDAMYELERRINGQYGDDSWQPVQSISRHLQDTDVLALYRLADVCVVSSLEDGMNLVAKEFLAARNDEQGHLLLSQFTGAAWEMPDAETFNPFAIDDFADRLVALSQKEPSDGTALMRQLRSHVRNHTIFDWMGSILESIGELRPHAS